MSKVDLKRRLAPLYDAARDRVAVVDVPPLWYLKVDGEGDPGSSPAYREAVEALTHLSHALKIRLKKGPEALDFSVLPLEGLWDWNAAAGEKSVLRWTAMILQPDAVKPELVEEARGTLAKKKPLAALPRVRFERLGEGRAAQILHLGPSATQGDDVARLHRFIADQGGRPRGRHHEIYLNDPGRTEPEKLKTVLRQPFA
jgi:hypothetical protein